MIMKSCIVPRDVHAMRVFRHVYETNAPQNYIEIYYKSQHTDYYQTSQLMSITRNLLIVIVACSRSKSTLSMCLNYEQNIYIVVRL